MAHLLIQDLNLSGIQGLIKDAELGQSTIQGATGISGIAAPSAENKGPIQEHGIATIDVMLLASHICMMQQKAVFDCALGDSYRHANLMQMLQCHQALEHAWRKTLSSLQCLCRCGASGAMVKGFAGTQHVMICRSDLSRQG